MSDSPFNGPQLQDTEYTRADMTNVHFNGVQLSGAKFWAVMEGASFRDTNLHGATFDDVNLSDSNLTNVSFSGSTIDNANLSGLRISNANLSDADISNANLIGMRINGVLVSDLFAAYEAATD